MIKLRNDMYIGEQITLEDINKWVEGNIITIEAGTGAGKSHFIKNNLYDNANAKDKKILLLVHRLNCEEQFKIEMKGKEDTIEIITYQTIDRIYEEGSTFDFSKYDYIVCDEFHYFMSDASFNNTTDMSIEAILEQKDKIRILMSATAEIMTRYLKNYRKLDIVSYKADMEFNFIEKLYLYKDLKTEELLIEEIINRGEKAIVFINDLKRLEYLYSKYKDFSLFNCAESEKEYKYVDKDKITKMLKGYKFEEQIVFATSVMDTGISIKDKEVKHIICNNIVDVNVLIQSIGRKRILDKDDTVNVYIKDINNNVLGGYLREANRKLEGVRYLDEYGKEMYIKKYRKKIEDKSIVYPDFEEGEFVLKKNEMAYFKTLVDIANLEIMIRQGYKQYISDVFNSESEYIEAIIEVQTLEGYLKSIINKRLYDKEQRELSDLIIKQLVFIPGNIDYRTTKLKPSTLENMLRVQLKLPYAVSEPKREDRKIDGKRVTRSYIVISKIA